MPTPSPSHVWGPNADPTCDMCFPGILILGVCVCSDTRGLCVRVTCPGEPGFRQDTMHHATAAFAVSAATTGSSCGAPPPMPHQHRRLVVWNYSVVWNYYAAFHLCRCPLFLSHYEG